MIASDPSSNRDESVSIDSIRMSFAASFAESSALTSSSVLVVDDDLMNITVMSYILEGANIPTYVA